MQKDLIADLHYAIDRQLSMEELTRAVNGLSGADQTRLTIGYSNAWEKRKRAYRAAWVSSRESIEVDYLVECKRADLQMDSALQELWQRITVF